MRVVSNTSPISNLAIIGRLDLLRRRYGTAALSHPQAASRVQLAINEGWLIVDSTSAVPPSSAPPLDAGEAEAIALGLALRADALLMDERRGREAARLHGLTVAGVLGELLHARLNGWLPDLRREINRLRTEARFFVDAEIEKFILAQAGE